MKVEKLLLLKMYPYNITLQLFSIWSLCVCDTLNTGTLLSVTTIICILKYEHT